MDFVKSLAVPPLVVFTTAYSEYAVEGFRVNAVDYLLKPFGLQDFQRAANRLKERLESSVAGGFVAGGSAADTTDDTIFLKTEYRIVKVSISDIRYGRAGNFNGSCYGFGYAIKNWTVSSAAAQASFFGQVYGGTLDSIVFKNCHMTTDNNYGSILTSGAYCDEVINCIEFDNCSVKNATAAGTPMATPIWAIPAARWCLQ